MKFLVVYYSRSDATEKVAKTIAGQLSCDIVGIVSKRKFAGPFGFIIAGFNAARKRRTPIEKPAMEPSDYDFVIIGTPVWASTMAAPLRTFLDIYRINIKKTAFFLTKGGHKITKAFADMEEVCGIKPSATLELRKRQVKKPQAFVDEAVEEISRFTAQLQD